MAQRTAHLAAGLLLVVWGAGGCAAPLAVWPEWPTGFGHTLRVETPAGRPAPGGTVLLRIYCYDGSGVAEGDRTVRNQQVLDEAFGYRRAIAVRMPAGAAVKYRLSALEPVPVGPAGLTELPGTMRAGSLWAVAGKEKAKGGLHPVSHFAEAQAFVPGEPPSPRREVDAELEFLRSEARLNPVQWRQELEYAMADLARARPEAYGVRRFLEEQLQALRERYPAAFVPDGIRPPADREDEGLP